MVRFHLVPDTPTSDPAAALQKIIDYLLTFVGEIAIQKEEHPDSVRISYPGTDLVATLGIGDGMTLTCLPDDQVTVNLIRNVTKNIGYRIFNIQTKSFLLNDPNVLDLSTTKLDSNMSNIFERYKLTPMFRYRDSLIFFAKDTEGRMRLINRHLLEYLVRHPDMHVVHKELSVVVAEDISRFVALFDRGLIPISFYNCINYGQKIVNFSGFPIDALPCDVFIEPIYFHFDPVKQTFTQGMAPSGIHIQKGRSLLNALKLKKYLAMKIGKDIGFVQKDKGVIPKLSVSVFLDA